VRGNQDVTLMCLVLRGDLVNAMPFVNGDAADEDCVLTADEIDWLVGEARAPRRDWRRRTDLTT